MSSTPSVGAFVVNFNGGDKILACLEALTTQTVPLDRIVVVDNGSTDGSLERVRQRFPAAHIIALGSNRGLPVARNTALQALDTVYAMSVDSDVYLAPDCTERLLEAQRAHDATVVCPRVVLMPGRVQIQCDGASAYFLGTMTLRHAFRRVDEAPPVGSFVGAAIGACLFLHRQRVLDAGGFDERFFFYFEDLEFCVRLRGRGLLVYCEPAAMAYHDRGRGTPGLSFRGIGTYPVRRAYLTMRHRWLVILVHYRLRTLIVLFPALVAYEFASVALSVMRGWLGAWARAWLWLLQHQREIRAWRRGVQRARMVGDADLLEGGQIPLAAGVIRSRTSQTAVNALSAVFDAYWRVAKRILS